MQDFRVARRAMVDSQLRPQGVTDRGVLAAMGAIPRELFVPDAARSFAYVDRSIRLGTSRSMMSPAALGRLLSELKPVAGERALVVGAGSGYSAAVLDAIGLKVTALEGELSRDVSAAHENINWVTGDLQAGSTSADPFDLILIDGGVEEIPAAIIAQLAPDGRLGTAIMDRGVSRLAIGRKVGDRLSLTTIVDADVAPLPGFERPQAFTF